MTVTVKFKNKERLFAKLRASVPKVDVAFTAVAQTSAQDMVRMAKGLVEVDEGDLRDSIVWGDGPRPASFIVQAGGKATTKPVRDGADASYDYALANEFGTQDMSARPFFWPSYRVTKRRLKGRISRAFGKAMKEAGF